MQRGPLNKKDPQLWERILMADRQRETWSMYSGFLSGLVQSIRGDVRLQIGEAFGSTLA